MQGKFSTRTALVLLFCVFSAGVLLWPPCAIGQVQEQSHLDVVLIVDMSSSMLQNDPDGLRISAARLVAELMAEGDRVAVVGFSRGAEQLSPGFTDDTNVIREALELASNQHIPEGGNPTEMAAGLREAYGLLSTELRADARGVAILLTDGRPCPYNGEREAEYERVRQEVDRFAARGWSVFTVGLCRDDVGDSICYVCDRDLMQEIAGKTGAGAQEGVGFYEASEAQELPQVYVSILATIHGLRRWDFQRGEPPYFYVLPGTKILMTVVRQSGTDLESSGCPSVIDLGPDGEPVRDVSQRRSCVQNLQVVRTDDPQAGDWHAWTQDSAEIVGLLVKPLEELRFRSPSEGETYQSGQQVPIAVEIVDSSSGIPVQDPEILRQAEVEVAVYKGAEFKDRIALGGTSAQRTATYTLPWESEGVYTFWAELGGFRRENVSIRVIRVTPTLTSTPTDMPTPTDTSTPTITPTPEDTSTPTNTPSPTATDTPSPTPTPTPTPVPALTLSQSALTLEWDKDTKEPSSGTLNVTSTSGNDEVLLVDLGVLYALSDEKTEVDGVQVKPESARIPAGSTNYPVTLALVKASGWEVGDYEGEVSFRTESGIDVQPAVVQVLFRQPGFIEQHLGVFLALVGALVAGLTILGVVWARQPWPAGRLVGLKGPGSQAPRGTALVGVRRSLWAKLQRKSRVIVGSGRGSDLQLAGGQVVQKHAEFITVRDRNATRTYIKPLAGASVMVDGAKAQPGRRCPLGQENRIALGDYEFKFSGPRKRPRPSKGGRTTRKRTTRGRSSSRKVSRGRSR